MVWHNSQMELISVPAQTWATCYFGCCTLSFPVSQKNSKAYFIWLLWWLKIPLANPMSYTRFSVGDNYTTWFPMEEVVLMELQQNSEQLSCSNMELTSFSASSLSWEELQWLNGCASLILQSPFQSHDYNTYCSLYHYNGGYWRNI